MKYDDRIKYMLGAYFGIKKMDEYSRKIFVLKDIENYIKDYLKDNKVDDFDYLKLAKEIEKNSLKEQLLDALILLNEMDGPLDLILMIKLKVKELKYNDK